MGYEHLQVAIPQLLQGRCGCNTGSRYHFYDAVANYTNLVKSADDIQYAVDFAKGNEGVTGVLVIIGDRLGAWGKIELVSL